MRWGFFGVVVMGLLWWVAPVVAVLIIGHLAAAGPAPRDPDGPGLLLGFWHGLILPVAFVMSLLHDDVAIYATQHDGQAYDGGFVFGVLVMAGGWVPRFTRTRTITYPAASSPPRHATLGMPQPPFDSWPNNDHG